jgi:hypothetical protein
VVLVAVVAVVASGCGGDDEAPPPPSTAVPEPPPPTTTVEPPPPPPPETETAPEPEPTPLPPPAVAFSWGSAGALVWHENDIDPTLLGTMLRGAGFGWVAVYLHDGLDADPVEADWAYRFRLASGLPVGGWGVLRTQPEEEAALADELVGRYELDFYIANPEVEFEFSGAGGPSAERSGRSKRFVDRFRALRPTVPAGVSSYCRPDRHDIDWLSWRQGGFVFLPQAYVNDVGPEVSPASCVASAAGFFPRDSIHPTVGMHDGVLGSLAATDYVGMLAAAGTRGFSVYLAETRMTETEWRVFGDAIASRGIALAAA